jgi:predicted site-specific integrase-resolvase
MADQFPDIMGMGDVVKYLRVSRQYVDRLARAGKLRCKDTSTGKVFLKSDVVAFQEAGMQKLRKPKKRRYQPKK